MDTDGKQRGMGRIFLRGTRYWISYYRNGEEFRESAESADRGVAERRLRTRLGQIHSEQFVGPKLERLKMSTVLEEYLTHLELKGAKAMKAAHAKTKRLLEAFGGDRVVAVTTGTIEDWMGEAVSRLPPDGGPGHGARRRPRERGDDDLRSQEQGCFRPLQHHVGGRHAGGPGEDPGPQGGDAEADNTRTVQSDHRDWRGESRQIVERITHHASFCRRSIASAMRPALIVSAMR